MGDQGKVYTMGVIGPYLRKGETEGAMLCLEGIDARAVLAGRMWPRVSGEGYQSRRSGGAKAKPGPESQK